MTRAGAAALRRRKLSTKNNLQILQEDQVEKNDDDEAQRNIPKVETGVEKGEEIVSGTVYHVTHIRIWP